MADHAAPGRDSGYVVVARRYRPQGFDELIGQQQVSRALANAISSGRVGHAYLFTGARGVGKTSAARIFAKALNCERGSSPAPCNECDICLSIAAGEDVDVLEIDGASNRGIDEIRQLRSNVNVRPSRSRFRIYIIDEVHMLTTAAFNALLKTLEEPPEHVKFIFCTTDPEKIPITVLSRCQRFDFAPVPTDAIQRRLLDIVAAEGAEAEEEALHILARRASGSMRDSQSLLEQLLSFGQRRITVDDVHALLGTAQSGRLTALAEQLQQRDAAAALAELDAALSAGVDAGQLTEQLLSYFRDMLVAALGGSDELLLQASPQQHAALAEAGRSAGVQTLLATLQVLDHALVRMRQSTQVRALLEMALVRICHLESLDDLPALLAQMRQGAAGATPGRAARSPQKKTGDPEPPAASSTVTASAPSPDSPETIPWDPQRAGEIWRKAADSLQDMTRDFALKASETAISGPNKLVVIFAERYNLQKEACERPERKVKIEQALAQVTGRRVDLDLRMAALPKGRQAEQTRAASRRQLMRAAERHPVVTKAAELFNAEVVKVEPLRRSDRPDAP